MNVHDSERLAGLLEAAGYVRHAPTPATPPTSSCSTPAPCARTPTTSSTATSGHLYPPRRPTPTCRSRSAAAWPRRTAAGSSRRRRGSTSCSARTTSPSLPVLLERARHNRAAAGRDRRGAAELPVRSARRVATSAFSAWVSVSVGCDNTCTFCIVPSLRGAETDRRPGDVLAEIRALVDSGVVEVTLLGQNVNSYGRSFGDRARVRQAAAGLRRRRRPGAGALHQPAPARLHRRRHRRRWPRRRT